MTLTQLIQGWRDEATEREARAENPDVVGWMERDCELSAVRFLRKCADELSEAIADGPDHDYLVPMSDGDGTVGCPTCGSEKGEECSDSEGKSWATLVHPARQR